MVVEYVWDSAILVNDIFLSLMLFATGSSKNTNNASIRKLQNTQNPEPKLRVEKEPMFKKMVESHKVHTCISAG